MSTDMFEVVIFIVELILLIDKSLERPMNYKILQTTNKNVVC